MKQLIFILFAFGVISNTYASDECLHRPGCEELGYIQTRKQCECFNKDVLPCPFNIKDDNTVFCGDLDCTDKCKDLLPFYDGQGNTKKIIEQAGEKGLAAYATSLFYVEDKTGDFGQGKWYLPSIGEWMSFYGTDMEKITNIQFSNGGVGDKMIQIEASLKTLATKGADAEILNNVQFNHYISSSMYSNAMNWKIDSKNGNRNRGYFHRANGGGGKVRAALMIRNCFNPAIGGIPPKVGDVMYQDKTYGAVSDYDGSKTPVGIVASVSETGRDVIILNLKDLTFNSQTEVNNFNPDNPYGETIKVIAWGLQTVALTFGTDDFVTDLQSSCNCNCMFYGEETNCPKVDHCAKYDGNCYCSQCENGYVQASVYGNPVTWCEDTKCPKVEHCAEYDENCYCSQCENGYVQASVYGNPVTWCEELCFGCPIDKDAEYSDYTEYKDYAKCQENCGSECKPIDCNNKCYRCSATNYVYGTEKDCSKYCSTGTCKETNNCSSSSH